jgi:hypothetical protein
MHILVGNPGFQTLERICRQNCITNNKVTWSPNIQPSALCRLLVQDLAWQGGYPLQIWLKPREGVRKKLDSPIAGQDNAPAVELPVVIWVIVPGPFKNSHLQSSTRI